MTGASSTPTSPDSIDLFSRCLGCGYEFQTGDVRLRFTMGEFGDRFGCERFDGDEMFDMGLCADCIQPGEFKTPEIVP